MNLFDAFRYGGPPNGGGPAVGNPPDTSGAASPATAPSTTPGKGPQGRTLLGTALGWITQALRPYNQQPPNSLDESAIIPTLDVLNQGWGLATYASGAIAFAAGTLSSIWNIIAASANSNAGAFTGGNTQPFPLAGTAFLAKLIGLDATHLNGAAPATINFFLVPSPKLFGASPAVTVASASVAANATASYASLVGGATILVPPGWDLEIQFPTTAAGELWAVHYAFACLPVGSRP